MQLRKCTRKRKYVQIAGCTVSKKEKKAKMQHCVVQIPQYHNPMTNYYPTPVPYHYQVTTPAAQKARTYELEDYSRDFVSSNKVVTTELS